MTALAGTFRIQSIGDGCLFVSAHPASNGDAALRIAEIARSGIQTVISLLQADEAQALGLQHERELVSAKSMDFISFPIADMGQPASVAAFADLAQRLYRDIHTGKHALIHCRAGVGRSGLLAAAVVMQQGRDAQQAFAEVARRRGVPVPETTGQGDWLAANQSLIIG